MLKFRLEAFFITALWFLCLSFARVRKFAALSRA